MPPVLNEITLPRTSIATTRTVLNGYLAATLRAFTNVPNHLLQPQTQAVYARTLALTRAAPADPHQAQLVSILRRPTQGALLWSALARLNEDGDVVEASRWVSELCLLVQLELAQRGALATEEVVERFDTGWPTLRSIAANTELALEEGVDQLRFGPRGLTACRGALTSTLPLQRGATPAGAPEDFPGIIRRPYHTIVDGISLALTDNNPLALEEAHPEKSGNAISLGGHPAEEWIDTLRTACLLVEKYLPLVAQEMRLLLRLIVPVGYHDQRHFSASYQEAVGTIYMTLHPNIMTMTEALIHEFQHNKINAAFYLDPMLDNAFSPLYKSPVRPDPRPLHGVILAVHAFQPIAKLYEVMTAAGDPLSKNAAFQERFRNIIRMNREGSRTVLENARPTAVGSGLFREMRALELEQLAYESAHWPLPASTPAPVLPE
jgi:HEXXH motif-containing protein